MEDKSKTAASATTSTSAAANQDKRICRPRKDCFIINPIRGAVVTTKPQQAQQQQRSYSPFVLASDAIVYDNDDNDDDDVNNLIIEEVDGGGSSGSGSGSGSGSANEQVKIASTSTTIGHTIMPGMSPTPSNECRRSARKKIIKFDVRDLLNKNRKSHKIQIEARIDSFATPTTPLTLNHKQNAAPQRRYSMFEQHPQPPSSRSFEVFRESKTDLQLNLAHPLRGTQQLKFENLIKPKKSLIVAQVESCPRPKTATLPTSLKTTSDKSKLPSPKIEQPLECSIRLPRRRGRPRKAKTEAAEAIITQPVPDAVHNNDLAATEQVTKTTASEYSELQAACEQLEASIEADTTNIDNSLAFKNVQCRVAVKRMTLPSVETTIDLTTSIESIEKVDEIEEKINENSTDDIIVLSPFNEVEVEEVTSLDSNISDERQLETESDVITLSSLSQSPEAITFEVVELSEKDSESPIAIEIELPAKANDDSNSVIELIDAKLIEERNGKSSNQRKNIEQMDLDNICVETQTLRQILATVQNQQDNQKPTKTSIAQIETTPSAASSPVPTLLLYNETSSSIDGMSDSARGLNSPVTHQRLRRTRRNSVWPCSDGGSNNSNKTLEETFAEIAAQSSKAILAEENADESIVVINVSTSQDANTSTDIIVERTLPKRRKTYCPSPISNMTKATLWSAGDETKASSNRTPPPTQTAKIEKSMVINDQLPGNSKGELKNTAIEQTHNVVPGQVNATANDVSAESEQQNQLDFVPASLQAKTIDRNEQLNSTEVGNAKEKKYLAIIAESSNLPASELEKVLPQCQAQSSELPQAITEEKQQRLVITTVDDSNQNVEKHETQTSPQHTARKKELLLETKTLNEGNRAGSKQSELESGDVKMKQKKQKTQEEPQQNKIMTSTSTENENEVTIKSDNLATSIVNVMDEDAISCEISQSGSNDDSLVVPIGNDSQQQTAIAVKEEFDQETVTVTATESLNLNEDSLNHKQVESVQKRRFSMFSDTSNNSVPAESALSTVTGKVDVEISFKTEFRSEIRAVKSDVSPKQIQIVNKCEARQKSEDDSTTDNSSGSTVEPPTTEISTPTYSNPSTPVPSGDSPTFELSKDSPIELPRYSTPTNSSNVKCVEMPAKKSANKRVNRRKTNAKEETTHPASIERDDSSTPPTQTPPPASPVTEIKRDTPTPVATAPTPTPSMLEDETVDPLKDIEKFIEAGVNLLKRDYKIDDDSVDNELSTTLGGSSVNSSSASEYAARVARLETPAETPEPPSAPSTPAATPPPTMTADDSQHSCSGVRRSHRIKQKPQLPKASVARGVVRDKERISTTDAGEEFAIPYSMDQQLIDLAEIEAINERFLKSERLNTFHMIRENVYKCNRLVSKETVDMQCECFLTAEEEAGGQLGCGEGCINRMIMIECGPYCSNKERCTNKRFQKQLCSPCRVFRTEKKGCGIVAETQIPPGEFVMEYVGEVIDIEEFERRQYIYGRDKNRHYYFMSLRSDAIIDATIKGNISRFINHSCDPNAETQKWTVNGELRIGFFSRKTILPGEEITFDYQYQRYGRDAQPCFCEATSCRGWIGKKPTTDDEFDSDSGEESSPLADEEDEAESGDDSQESKRSGTRKLSTPKPRKRDLATASGTAGKSSVKTVHRKRKTDQQRSQQSLMSKDRQDRESGKKRVASSEKTMVRLEDPDVVEEVALLSRSGLKNQSNTLQLSRIMVRAKLVKTRLNLLCILRHGELPCRRLFLDYHGLRLLHGWMNENGNNLEFRLTLLKTMENLPIPNKTMLHDSKIYQTIKNWLNTEPTTDPLPATDEPAPQECRAVDLQELSKRIGNLLTKWDGLPEIFRIPKRIERIEQMKEHEREADRQTIIPALEDNSASTPLNTDRYKRDRFGRDIISRYGKPSAGVNSSNNANGHGSAGSSKATSSGNNISLSLGGYKSELRRRSDVVLTQHTYERNKYLSKELRREMFERKVARHEAEKRMAEARRIFEAKCHFFGLDPLTYDPKNIPAYSYEDTGEWFNAEGMPVPSPPRCGNAPPPPATLSTNPAHYILPEAIERLPPFWSFAITSKGYLYYYSLLNRAAQWELPTEQQLKDEEDAESSSSESGDSDMDTDTMVKIDGEYAASLTHDELKRYIEEKVAERRQRRYEKLVSVRTISPRRDEDRVYNQIESRKYKENKEKIRRRKEAYRRRRQEIALAPKITANLFVKPFDGNALPIQDYLYSSDEVASDMDDCNNSPLIDVIVQGEKLVDELDALNSRRPFKRTSLPLPQLKPHEHHSGGNKRAASPIENAGVISKKQLLLPLPPTAATSGYGDMPNTDDVTASATVSLKRQLPIPLPPLNLEPSTSKAAAAAAAATAAVHDAIIAAATDEAILRQEHKRRRLDRERRREERRSIHISSNAREKFRCEMALVVVDTLKPYRKESCTRARITTDADFNHLARRLTHYIMTKEVKYCESIGQTLVVNESVKHKAREYIKIYLQKYGEIYQRPDNGQEFKEIPILN